MNTQEFLSKIRDTDDKERDRQMKIRKTKFEYISPIDILVLREKLGMKRYRKMSGRAPEKRKVLLNLALKKMEEEEKDDFILIGFRRRKVNIV